MGNVRNVPDFTLYLLIRKLVTFVKGLLQRHLPKYRKYRFTLKL